MTNHSNKEKELAAKEAVKLITENQIVGLGTGSTAVYAVREIGSLVKGGLKIRGVPTSNKTKEFAEQLGITLVDINKIDFIDITIDGADEFTADMNLIKGGGGALLKEKIVASMTKQEIIIADSSKKVDRLGKFPLPIEVIPFAHNHVIRKLAEINGVGKIRLKDGSPFVTDQGNYIIDTDFGIIQDPADLSHRLNDIVGVVEHGLFIKLAKKVIMGIADTNTAVIFEQ
jgi:ribose 5-phosphate isomerase A